MCTSPQIDLRCLGLLPLARVVARKSEALKYWGGKRKKPLSDARGVLPDRAHPSLSLDQLTMKYETRALRRIDSPMDCTAVEGTGGLLRQSVQYRGNHRRTLPGRAPRTGVNRTPTRISGRPVQKATIPNSIRAAHVTWEMRIGTAVQGTGGRSGNVLKLSGIADCGTNVTVTALRLGASDTSFRTPTLLVADGHPLYPLMGP